MEQALNDVRENAQSMDISAMLAVLASHIETENATEADVTQTSARLEHAQKSITEHLKQRYHALKRLSTVFEKVFDKNINDLAQPDMFADEETSKVIDTAILDHLYHVKYMDLAKVFASESHIAVSKENNDAYSRLQLLEESLERHEMEPLVHWVSEHYVELGPFAATILYTLHRRQFLRIALCQIPARFCPDDMADANTTTNVLLACTYGQKHLRTFQLAHLHEIQRLFTILLYLPHVSVNMRGEPLCSQGPSMNEMLANIPALYQTMMSCIHMQETSVFESFKKEYARIYNLPLRNLLQMTVDTGLNNAVARIIHAQRVLKKPEHDWVRAEQLPVEIPVPHTMQMHSTVLCPVTKEACTPGNPPVRLNCGHVVSQDSLPGLRDGAMFYLCPYCSEGSLDEEVLRLHF